ANSDAMALPRPVPPPVTNTQTSVYVPAGSALAPTGGGAGSPIVSAIGGSAPRVARCAVVRACGAHLRHVVAATDEGLVDHLVGHRVPDLRLGEVPDDL